MGIEFYFTKLLLAEVLKAEGRLMTDITLKVSMVKANHVAYPWLSAWGLVSLSSEEGQAENDQPSRYASTRLNQGTEKSLKRDGLCPCAPRLPHTKHPSAMAA